MCVHRNDRTWKFYHAPQFFKQKTDSRTEMVIIFNGQTLERTSTRCYKNGDMGGGIYLFSQ